MKNQAVAWCETCDRTVDQDRVEQTPDGRSRCPACGGRLTAAPRQLADEAVEPGEPATSAALRGQVDGDDAEEHVKAPWHFKVLVVGTAGYLVYRLIWVVFWLTGHAWHG